MKNILRVLSLVLAGLVNATAQLTTNPPQIVTVPSVVPTNFPGPTVTVSPIGLADGCAAANNGAQFGPDTASTTTSGIQEGVNWHKRTTLTNSFAGGGRMILWPGTFNCSTPIIVTNSGAFNLVVEGAGKTATILKYTGSNTNFIGTSKDSVSGPPGGASLQISLAHLGITATDTNHPISLLRLYALNEADIDDVAFFPFKVMTNGGANLNYTPSNGNSNMLTAIEVSGDNMLRIRNSAIWCCARGVKNFQAHTRVWNTIWDGVNDRNSLLSFDGSGAGSSGVFPKSFAISSQADLMLYGCHWDGVDIPIISANYVENHDPVFESCTIRGVVDGTVNGATLVHVYPNAAMGADVLGDKTINASGVLSDSTDGSIVSVEGPFGDGKLWGIRMGGNMPVFAGTSVGLSVSEPVISTSTNYIHVEFAGTNIANGDYVLKGLTNVTASLGGIYPLWTNTVASRGAILFQNDANGPNSIGDYMFTTSDLLGLMYHGAIGGSILQDDPQWGAPPTLTYFGKKGAALAVPGRGGLTNGILTVGTGIQSSCSNYTTAATSREMNTWSGTVKLSSGQKVYTVRNSLVSATSTIVGSINTDGAGTVISNIVPASGKFTITTGANVGTDTTISWTLVHQ
jgi:hypothetical protein